MVLTTKKAPSFGAFFVPIQNLLGFGLNRTTGQICWAKAQNP